jgi:uncharacterized protein YnzC (UPF0291/DUF896 family)
MKNNLITVIRQSFSCLIFFIAGCQHSSPYKNLVLTKEDSVARQAVIQRAWLQIEGFQKQIQNGDIITRTGNDFTSESLRTLNRRDKTWSHCGIASIENDSVFVYHALGGDFNPDQKIRRDAISDFADPNGNRCIGSFRFQLPDSIKRQLLAITKDLFQQGVMFDMDFDLLSDDRMYCAEFVCKSLVKSSSGKLVFNHSHIKAFEFIGVDDIFLHPLCSMKQQIVYK